MNRYAWFLLSLVLGSAGCRSTTQDANVKDIVGATSSFVLERHGKLNNTTGLADQIRAAMGPERDLCFALGALDGRRTYALWFREAGQCESQNRTVIPGAEVAAIEMSKIRVVGSALNDFSCNPGETIFGYMNVNNQSPYEMNLYSLCNLTCANNCTLDLTDSVPKITGTE